MKIKEICEISSRGILFTYEFGDSVYLINTQDKLILCDTSEGKKEMEYVKQYIKDKEISHKPLFIFNSHSDWDHIRGNDSFINPYIIGHTTCRERIKERADLDLEIFPHSPDNNIEIKLPNITFQERLVFEEDDIEFIYTPGHTVCSATCYDHKDKVMYVGDLMEYPIPVINSLYLEAYIQSLETIKRLSPQIIITSHSKIVSNDLIDKHINYLQDVLSGKYLTSISEIAPIRHGLNLKNLLILKYDEKVKEKLGYQFEYKSYKLHLWDYISTKHKFQYKQLWDISDISIHDLKQDLEEYLENIQENSELYYRKSNQQDQWS
ncbi:MBL fold metallo-hydrolase [Mycoplasmatota bacterium]|nr:MBL fold metallo-hydrolase [Mycoplasmatota bacterium]